MENDSFNGIQGRVIAKKATIEAGPDKQKEYNPHFKAG